MRSREPREARTGNGESYTQARLGSYFDALDLEIARLALRLEVRIAEPGVLEQVLRNELAVCGRPDDAAFKTLRALLVLHFSARAKAVKSLGPAETARIVQATLARIRQRVGGALDEPPRPAAG